MKKNGIKWALDSNILLENLLGVFHRIPQSTISSLLLPITNLLARISIFYECVRFSFTTSLTYRTVKCSMGPNMPENLMWIACNPAAGPAELFMAGSQINSAYLQITQYYLTIRYTVLPVANQSVRQCYQKRHNPPDNATTSISIHQTVLSIANQYIGQCYQ
jgi:hypothetical protein